MEISLRPAHSDDFKFCRQMYYECMGWIIERLFGWDQARENAKFAKHFKLDEVEIVVVDGRDAGWLQAQTDAGAITLGQIYVSPALQRRGIGTEILKRLLARARREGKAVTLSVVKINPASHLYERHGFRTTHEDENKFYMRWDFTPGV
jgi:ribosomal protein S18 acetylase RimI-like enzyme